MTIIDLRTPAFRCTPQPERSRVRVVVEGELDLATAAVIGNCVGELLGDGFTDIVVDVRELVFLDLTGLRALAALRERATGEGRAFALEGATGPVLRLIRLMRTDHLLARATPGEPARVDGRIPRAPGALPPTAMSA